MEGGVLDIVAQRGCGGGEGRTTAGLEGVGAEG